MKDAFYFSHDSNARNDEKILIMRSVYGAEGYGWYWMLIEMMRDANAYRLQCDGKYSLNALASELRCDKEKFVGFVQDCIKEFGLFASDGSFFWSESLLRRMIEKETKSLKAKQSAHERWQKNANASDDISERNANASKNDAIKEKKVNNIKEIYKENSKLIIEYLNQKSGKKFKPTDSNLKPIFARFKENYTVEDLQKVIDVKCQSWINTSNQMYLRPETLFGSKFDGYLNEAPEMRTHVAAKSLTQLEYMKLYNPDFQA